jgi:hypothetical protein
MPGAPAVLSNPLEAGGVVARPVGIVGCAGEQALAEGPRRGTTDRHNNTPSR